MANPQAARTTRETVTVACKLPHGIVLRDHIEAVSHENVMGGGTRQVKVFRPVGAKVFIKGPLRKSTEIVGGYAITENVDAGVFNRWMEWNKDSAAVRNEMIFGHEKRARVVAWAREREGKRSGFEPLDVSMVTKGDRKALADDRIQSAGAGQVIDGKVKETAA